MTNRNLLLAVVLLGAAVSGIVLAQAVGESADAGQWEMFSQNVAGTGGSGGSSAELGVASAGSPGIPVEGALFLYSKQTGKVYRIFTGCGDLGQNGCIEALPIVMEGQFSTVVPQPQTDRVQIRR